MNAPQNIAPPADIETAMQAALQLQRESYLSEGMVSAGIRIDRINRAIDMLVKHSEAISDAMNQDFGCRPRQVNLMTDVSGSIGCLKHCRQHLKGWMKQEKRSSMFPLNLLGGRSTIEYQPKGVVGVLAPWNFPLGMVFEPLAGVLAAGNRAMIKPSEFTPATSALISDMVSEAFDPTELCVFTGGPEVGQAFSGLPFDHMIFTGATSVARHIMGAAARNLVPVTLELGGKSPVVISRSADLTQAVERVMVGKLLNAGQVCIAPDYLLVPEELLDEVIAQATRIVTEMYPSLLNNEQYTAVVNDRHYQRLTSYLNDADQRGVKTVSINPGSEDFEANPMQKMPPTLIINPDDEALCMQDEIFGPLLPIKTYKNFEETISYINSKPRPLAAYYFGKDKAQEERFLTGTTSGGVCINDVMFHMLQKDLPFGGIGPSGMGAYHGVEGFKTFSHAKAIYRQTKHFNVAKLAGLLPPYGDTSEKNIRDQIKR
ncbi:MAG: coniferyl aldehyde dehydrogenase [SAR86 cluster bacterium]|uniref:Aldehyde dehydrogenase n=1 Tax=SAR86 cluster bacterium TaxID=2030880 RepID=A0A972VZV1_9GAMM|nr:coniferyl aldehyde dehydrogenase [SAR86 cluster bacterium]